MKHVFALFVLRSLIYLSHSRRITHSARDRAEKKFHLEETTDIHVSQTGASHREHSAVGCSYGQQEQIDMRV